MKITKKFTAESSHIVRNCSSDRCKYSIHGHSYIIELTLEGNKLDNAGMLVDFGLLKGSIKEFIDSMDHCHVFCSQDNDEYIKMCQKYSKRWIMLPFNPSAEMLSLFFHAFCQHIIENTIWVNGEDVESLRVHSVTVHETATGRAESSVEDYKRLWNPLWMLSCCFSNEVIESWGKPLHKLLLDSDGGTYKIKNTKPTQQITHPSVDGTR